MATLRYLKSGASAIRGSVCFVNRTKEVLKLMTLLPRLPEEMEIVELHKGRLAGPPRKFNVRIKMVRKALVWLKKNHPAYFDIEIDESKMRRLEEGLVDQQLVVPRIEVPKHIDLHANLGNMGSNQDKNKSDYHDSHSDHHQVSKMHRRTFWG